jgi:carboxyl-terminal processing protease
MTNRLKYLLVTFSTAVVVLLLLGGTLGKTNAAEDAYRHFAVFSEVLSYIKSSYVEEPDLKSVTLGALSGLLESIDPFASYLNADQYKSYLKTRETAKGDVGLLLARRAGHAGVAAVLPDSPAARAGLDTYDVIEAINGVSTRDMPLAYADMLLQGAPGTSVELTVLRVRQGTESEKVTLVREPRRLPEASARMVQEGIGYLKVPALDASRLKEIPSLIASLERQGARQLILDLRGNAWGDPETGIALADMFLDKGLIASVEGQKVSRREFHANAERTVFSKPLVVLTNRSTLGGAEIAVAALLENKRAEVVGERTFGDAAVRRAINMEDGGAVILAVAKYYPPKSAKAISDAAVTPSVIVAEADTVRTGEEDEEEAAPPTEPQPQPNEDVILKKAIEVLTRGAVARDDSQTVPATDPTAPRRQLVTPLNAPKPPE